MLVLLSAGWRSQDNASKLKVPEVLNQFLELSSIWPPNNFFHLCPSSFLEWCTFEIRFLDLLKVSRKEKRGSVKEEV